MIHSPHIRIRTWGDYACFTRPEFKVERSTYPMITPSAARGILEAIFWRPEFRYEIRRLGVVKHGSPMVIVRNEISDRQSQTPIQADANDKRVQRSSLILRDVEYLIEADIVLRRHATDPLAKYLAQATRRIERGQYFHTPYLGTREFAAFFEPAGDRTPHAIDMTVGTMLFDIAFVPSSTRRELDFRMSDIAEPVGGYTHALFSTTARLDGGWWTVSPLLYEQLYQLERGHV